MSTESKPKLFAIEKAIKALKKPELAFEYCKYIDNDPEVRQIIVDAKSSFWALQYCIDVSDDADMQLAILNSDDERKAYHAYAYCYEVRHDDRMRQLIIDTQDLTAGMWYYKNVSTSEDDLPMKKLSDGFVDKFVQLRKS